MATNELATIILRFRDLNTKDTIGKHRAICNDSSSDDYVWWGWWSKPQEKLPADTFMELNNKCSNEKGLEIFLFDSGHLRLYKAVCEHIEFSNDAKEQTSPEKGRTPEYYRDQEYLAWFKLRNISDPIEQQEAESLLKQYSYYRVDSFFLSGKSPFGPFYNKIVFSLNELFNQQRTIWFIRKANSKDKRHEISSYSGNLIIDKNIDSGFKPLSTSNVLWLSDLHFSQQHHEFNKEAGSDNTLYVRIKDELEHLNKTISHVIISGDFTFESKKEEFDAAAEFIQNMNSVYQLSDTCYSICPGNHDICFAKKSPSKGTSATVATEDAKKEYIEFYRQMYGVNPTESLYSIRRLLGPGCRPIEIISVNSCTLQQDAIKFKGMGYVGNDQIREIEEKLAVTKEENSFRILVLHHHLIPVVFSEKNRVGEKYSLTLDSEAVSQFIVRNGIQLVLHGHAHKGFYSEITRYITSNDSQTKIKKKYYLVGLGSTGAISKDLSDGATNMFGILNFMKDTLRIEWYDLYASGQSSKLIDSFDIPYFENASITIPETKEKL